MNECNHDKVYDNQILCSDPPQRRWICACCYEQGTETIGISKDYGRTYDEIVSEKPAKGSPVKDNDKNTAEPIDSGSNA